MNFDRPSARLLLAGASALFWQLALIRWEGSCIRIVAYYSNFVLLAAFFGLGVGALLARRETLRLERFVIPAVAAIVLLGIALEGRTHLNPGSADEYVWAFDAASAAGGGKASAARIPFWVPLSVVYLFNAATFAIFGQWIARLFQSFRPLTGYSIEVAGSVLGILFFAALSFLGATPAVWFLVGFVLLFAALPRERSVDLLGLACAVLALGATVPFAAQFIWSPYYKIRFEPFASTAESPGTGSPGQAEPALWILTVNNDFHQMLLDLSPRENESARQREWRALYDAPYQNAAALPDGPILVVGCGTGNDVSAALRRTNRAIDAVDIDRTIVGLGLAHSVERPYQNPRVHVVIDDARSFFQHTKKRYAIVVFGFLDSHTLLSSFSSVRLDNFVYTREAMAAARELLLPGGEVYLTFQTTRPWIHDRLLELLNRGFDAPTQVFSSPGARYAYGIVYRNRRARETERSAAKPVAPSGIELPTDDWPFLYLREKAIPSHYQVFIGIVLALGCGALLLLPRGERRLRLPYFFMGAAFFLTESSNVIRLSLLYGSTWVVNVTVFTGILVLVLLGNLTAARRSKTPNLPVLFALLAANILVAYLTPVSALLSLPSAPPRALVAVVVYLGPVYVAALIFANLISTETRFYEAYGSNVLGTVVGGAFEYLSLATGFRFLLLLTFGLYALVFLLLRFGGHGRATTASASA